MSNNLIYKNFTDITPLEQNNKTGFVKLIANVYGILDLSGDIVDLGAFSDTKAKDVQIIDNHDYSSVQNIIAKTLDVYEVDRSRLPESIKEQFPDATGGLVLNIQFPMSVTKSREIYNQIAAGLVKEFSIGFNIIKQRKQNMTVDGKAISARVIEKGRLREVSSVLIGANQATQVLEVRSNNKALAAKRNHILANIQKQRYETMSAIQKEMYIKNLMIDKLVEMKTKGQ